MLTPTDAVGFDVSGRRSAWQLRWRRRTEADQLIAIERLRLQVSAGHLPTGFDGLPARCRRALTVAAVTGAPMLAALDAVRAAAEDVQRAERAVTVASAQARVVAVGLLVAPVLLVPGLSRIVGVDLVAFYSTSLGLLVLAVGVSLLLLGGLLIHVLIRRLGTTSTGARGGGAATITGLGAAALAWWTVGAVAAPLTFVLVRMLVARRTGAQPALPGFDEAADLAALAVTGGASPAEALRLAAEQLPALAPLLRRLAFGLDHGTVTPEPVVGSAPDRRTSAGVGRGLDPSQRLGDAVATATGLGAPVASTLQRLAQDLRADQLARSLAAAERLAPQLTFPTALCLLPATVLLVGAPIVHAGLSTVGI